MSYGLVDADLLGRRLAGGEIIGVGRSRWALVRRPDGSRTILHEVGPGALLAGRWLDADGAQHGIEHDVEDLADRLARAAEFLGDIGGTGQDIDAIHEAIARLTATETNA